MNRYLFTSILLLFCILSGRAQIVQTVRGIVIEKNTLQPIPFANIYLKSDTQKGTSTDIEGRFILNGVQVGRQIIICTAVGYKSFQTALLEVTSAKQVILEIQLENDLTQMDEVTITATGDKGGTGNPFNHINGIGLSPQETQRIPGNINDMGRAMMSRPGVQMSQNDNENTMIVRGNSPFGLAWRLEGMEIPNPNHFAETGASGGGITALSMFVLGRSDFLTGSFAAQYGNAFSGVVDMNFRKGNTINREQRIQIGVIGLDYAAEGPISKSNDKNSFLFNYRYSTLGLLNAFGIRVVSPNVANVFQDLSFNLFLQPSNKTTINIYGLGGISSENKETDDTPEVWNDYRIYDYPSNLGVFGIRLRHSIDSISFFSAGVAAGFNSLTFDADTVSNLGVAFPIEKELYKDGRITAQFTYTREPDRGSIWQSGFYLTNYLYEVSYTRFNYETEILNTLNKGRGNTQLIEVYSQYQKRANEKLTIDLGFHFQFLTLNNSWSAEPRAGLSYQHGKNTFGISYGLHGRILPFNVYETTLTQATDDALISKPNRDLPMIRSHQFSGTYLRQIKEGLILKLEPYYQFLIDVPVSSEIGSTYSILNLDDNFEAATLKKTGQGRNQGIDLTIEKFFENGMFFFAGGSLYNSEYRMDSNSPWYNTRFNSRVNGQATMGREWSINNVNLFEAGFRVIYGNGLRHSPLNAQESRRIGWPVIIQDEAFTLTTKDYFRADVRIAYRHNHSKRSWKLSLDIQNVTNRVNQRRPYYDRLSNTIKYDPQASLIPAISYTLDF